MRRSPLARLPGAFKAGVWGLVAAHTNYVISRYARLVLLSSLAVSVIFSIALLFVILPQGVGAMLPFTLILLVIYLIPLWDTMGNLARELGSSEASLYLSTPLSRLGYVVSWLLAVGIQLSLAFALAIVVPILIIEPSLLTMESVLGLVLAGIGEIIYYSSIVLLVALYIKRKSHATAAGVFMGLIGPFIALLLIAIYSSVTGHSISSRTLRDIIGIFHPVIMVDDTLTDYTVPIVYSFISSLILLTMALRYARDKLEV